MVYDWVDAAMEPTPNQLALAKANGAVAVGFYVGGHLVDPYHVWNAEAVDLVRQYGLVPVPIYVPDPGLPLDPQSAAKDAYNACAPYGLKPSVSVLYNGNRIAATGPVWLPIWGGKPSEVGPASAIQWGSTLYDGWNVDLSIAASDFPFRHALCVDFEFNTRADPTWYVNFQLTLPTLTTIPKPVIKPIAPTPKPKERDMLVIQTNTAPARCFLLTGGGKTFIHDVADANALLEGLGQDKTVLLDPSTMESIPTLNPNDPVS